MCKQIVFGCRLGGGASWRLYGFAKVCRYSSDGVGRSMANVIGHQKVDIFGQTATCMCSPCWSKDLRPFGGRCFVWSELPWEAVTTGLWSCVVTLAAFCFESNHTLLRVEPYSASSRSTLCFESNHDTNCCWG